MSKIKKLPPDVINKIAAGEVVQRPANAIKELIENCIDAGSSTIKLRTKKGGLDLIQIEDDGCGIAAEDLPLAGVRFATSKLSEYDDLKSIKSFGFRGEALASISHCAHLEIISKPAAQAVAHKIKFVDGKAVDEAKPAARRNGTTIRATNLYHNMATRKGTMSVGDERNKIAEVLRAYAVHYCRCAFTWFRVDSSTTIIKSAGSIQRQDAIRTVYGRDIAGSMLHFVATDEKLRVTIESHCSDPSSYEGKKFQLVLFINGRLVNCKSIKSTVESVFSTFLGRTNKPFVYLSLEMPGKNIDVNVHPTKLEVQFLHEEKINDLIQIQFDKLLKGKADERTMKCAPSFFNESETSINLDVTVVSSSQNSQPRRDNYNVREDAKQVTLDSFLNRETDTEVKVLKPRQSVKRKAELNLTVGGVTKRQKLELDSMKALEKERVGSKVSELKKVLTNCSLVGAINEQRCLVQFETGLIMLEIEKISEDMFCQIILADYGNFDAVLIDPPVPLIKVARLIGLSEDQVQPLLKMATMMDDYFAMRISPEGELTALPILLENHSPSVHHVHRLIKMLCTQVVWGSEKECLGSISRALAAYYALLKGPSWRHTMEHVLLQMMKSGFYKPGDFGEKTPYRTVTSLPQLYKVFERC